MASLAVVALLLLLSIVHPVRGQTNALPPQFNVTLMICYRPLIDPTVEPPGKFNAVKPQEFDPGKTNLVQAAWLNSIGCPMNETEAISNPTGTGIA